MSAVDATFPLYGPLPHGQVAIEASAGTGKTFTLATLATRYLAERDIRPSELLIVTFTRAATAELRARIRERLVHAADALDGDSVDFGNDELVAHLARRERPERRRRLVDAVADFDTATIATMHSFAGAVRGTLGLSAAVDPDARLTTDIDSLVRHACADTLATAAAGGVPLDELPKLSAFVTATERFIGDPGMALEPTWDREAAKPAHRRLRDLVLAAQANLVERRRVSGTMGYDDVLEQLRRALSDPSSNSVVDGLRNRYSVVLIDEFQDTDRTQWEIFSTVFGRGVAGSTLVLVGDPKQAIYRFRGADISVYVQAVGAAGTTRHTLGTNWRSDDAAVEAMRRFALGATFGDASISYVDVEAAPDRGEHLQDASGASQSGFAIRVAVGDWLPRNKKLPVTPLTGRIVNRDMVAHIRALLDGSTIPDKDAAEGRRRLLPSDIAVLVASGRHGRSAQNALLRQGVPAVISGAGSVLSSWAADQVRLLLAAMERPADVHRVRAYALSWFESWEPGRVAAAGDEELAGLQERLAGWTSRLGSQPVAEVLAAIWAETDVVARLLGEFDGDRNVTDLDHLAELLHDNVPHGRAGVAELLGVLDHPPEADEDLELSRDVLARRVESEAQAVQIMTIWKAKGLEFPVVCLPMLWRRGPDPSDVVYTDPDSQRRTMDLAKGVDWPDKAEAAARKQLARTEEASEQLRLLYVALTRAKHHTAIWWANSERSSARALSRFLFTRDPSTGAIDGDRFATGTCTIPDELDVVDHLAPLVRSAGGAITVTSIAPPQPPDGPWTSAATAEADSGLGVRPFTVALERSVHRWSFSSITAGTEPGPVDPYDPTGADGGAADERAADDGGADGRDVDDHDGGGVGPAPPEGALDGLRAGTEFGTFVHAVLERTDFAADDLAAEVGGTVDAELARSGATADRLAAEGTDGRGLLTEGLCAAIGTPLGPMVDGMRLSDLDRGARLDELSFDLRVGGGGRPASVGDLAGLVLRDLPAGDPLRPWAESVSEGAIDVCLSGYLTGSIDLVARVAAGGTPAYLVADYKTNRLTPRGAAPGPSDYDRAHMADAMAEHHYPLQALLYGVALHRYLRSRRRRGAPADRILGAAYLFVRGMTGATDPQAGTPTGVFTWTFADGLLDEASELLDGRVAGGRA